MLINVVFTVICYLDIAIWKWPNFDKILENFDQKMLTLAEIMPTKHSILMFLETRYKGYTLCKISSF